MARQFQKYARAGISPAIRSKNRLNDLLRNGPLSTLALELPSFFQFARSRNGFAPFFAVTRIVSAKLPYGVVSP